MNSRKIDPAQKLACERCPGKLKRLAKWRVQTDGGAAALCHHCRAFALAEEEHKRLKIDNNLLVQDFVGSDATRLVEKFVLHKLGVFRLEAQVFVTLKQHKMHVGDVTIRTVIPPQPRQKDWGRAWWMEARTHVREDLKFPFLKKVATQTCQIEDKLSLALLGPRDHKWFYEHEEVTFTDEAEAFVFGVGAGVFKLLRRMKLVPGLATRVGMNKAGADWLKEFKTWRTGDTGVAPLPPVVQPQVPLWTGCDPKRVDSAHRAWETRRKQKRLGRVTP